MAAATAVTTRTLAATAATPLLPAKATSKETTVFQQATAPRAPSTVTRTLTAQQGVTANDRLWNLAVRVGNVVGTILIGVLLLASMAAAAIVVIVLSIATGSLDV